MRFPCYFLLTALLPVLPCLAQTFPPPWNPNTLNQWWSKHATPDTWITANDELKRQLTDNYQLNGATAFSNSDFQQWLRHLQWLRLGIQNKELLADNANREAFINLAKSDAVSHLFVEKIDPANNQAKALENLLRIAQANLNDLQEYPALGVAYALLFDRPFPKYWPHHQVDKKAVPIGDLDVVTRFNFYVDANRTNKLSQDISKLNFDEIKFVVDTQVSLDELRYGQSNKSNRISYTNFDQAFPSIQYSIPRYNSKQWDWVGSTYRLQDIETKGGICVDQAYYAVTLGKARGIPTLYFHGQGSNGGHAWFGFLQRNGKWNLDCGRYASQNYPVGYAYDPQTWQELNDVTLKNIARNISRDEKYEAAQTGLAWAQLNQKNPNYRQILKDTRNIMPDLPEAWQLEGNWIDKNVTDNDEKKSFYNDWIKTFSTNRDMIDMKVEGQKRLLTLLKSINDPSADQLQQDIVLYNRKKRFDLGIGAGAGSLYEKLESKDWQAARQEYEQLVRNFNQQGGGNLYYQIIRPYVLTCVEEKQFQLARQAVKYAQNRMSYSSDSILAQEFFRLNEFIKSEQGSSGGNPDFP